MHMALVDSQGRLFGKISILDLGAILVILLVIIGILTGTSTPVLPQLNTKAVEVEALVKGLGSRSPSTLMQPGEKTNLIIRNQPYGQITIKSVKILPRNVLAPQQDGTLKPVPDPLAEQRFSTDMLIVLDGKAQLTPSGLVFGNSKVKVGSIIELDGPLYNFNASVIDVRIQS
jgi:hypothetical protein